MAFQKPRIVRTWRLRCTPIERLPMAGHQQTDPVPRTMYGVGYRKYLLKFYVYGPEHDDKVILEIDFETQAEADSFELPLWLAALVIHAVKFKRRSE